MRRSSLLRAGLAIAAAVLACGGPLRPIESPESPAAPAKLAEAALHGTAAPVKRLPTPADLPCFPCHSAIKFEKGPPFAHGIEAHRTAGHCHLCHQGEGHHDGKTLDRGACLTCHAEGSKELSILATTSGTSSR